MIDLSGKTALVTGSSRNIGRSIALTFARLGAMVVVHGNNSVDECQAVSNEIIQLGGKSCFVRFDITKDEEIETGFEKIRNWNHGLDILVNCVGVRPRQDFLETSRKDWTKVLDTNLIGAMRCTQEAIPFMRNKMWGRVINISGIDGSVGMTERAATVASKSGLIGLSKALALENGAFGITVNSVIPGLIDTFKEPEDYPYWPYLKAQIKRAAIPRLGTCEDVAFACSFLASELSSYITGQSINVSGGLVMS